MGNYLSYKTTSGKSEGVRLGTNGSGEALMRLFAVGYAASRMPDARRAMPCVVPMRNADTRFVLTTTKQQVFDLIALNNDECFWVDFLMEKAATGFFMAPPKCQTYEAILVPLILLRTSGSRLILPPENVVKTAAAWDAVLPFLERSPARGLLGEMVGLAKGAAENNSVLEMA